MADGGRWCGMRCASAWGQATLTVRPCLDLGPGGRLVVVDCRHATTTLTIVGGPGVAVVPDELAARLALARHHALEGCRCTTRLRRRSGQEGRC